MAGWLERAYVLTNKLFYTPEQGAYIQTTSWEWFYFHANSWATSKNPLAQDKSMPETKLKI